MCVRRNVCVSAYVCVRQCESVSVCLFMYVGVYMCKTVCVCKTERVRVGLCLYMRQCLSTYVHGAGRRAVGHPEAQTSSHRPQQGTPAPRPPAPVIRNLASRCPHSALHRPPTLPGASTFSRVKWGHSQLQIEHKLQEDWMRREMHGTGLCWGKTLYHQGEHLSAELSGYITLCIMHTMPATAKQCLFLFFFKIEEIIFLLRYN